MSTASNPSHVVVIGASAGGLATVEALRRKGYEGTITVVGAEKHEPYDRPPLSKRILSGDWSHERARLRTREALTATRAEFVLADPAVALDAMRRTVHTASGRALAADAVVVATGMRARTLPRRADLAGVHVLRTLDDALALRTDLSARRDLVVVGDGVLGSEIAATARIMGSEVTLVGPQPFPMAERFGASVGEPLAELHTERGVRLRSGAGVDGMSGQGGRVTRLLLDSGEVLPAEVVVAAVGGEPATDWLADSGLRVDDGVVCDSRCRAAEGIYAVGDVARFDHEGLGVSIRLENRTNATEQAAEVAANLLGEDRPYLPVPHFWTDQFGTKIQVHGLLTADSEMTVVDGDLASRRFVALYRRGGEATGVLGWNMPKRTRQWRQELLGSFRDRAPAFS